MRSFDNEATIYFRFEWGGVYFISSVLANEIWFIVGMFLCVFEIKRAPFKKSGGGMVIGAIFLILSVVARNTENGIISFLLGVMASIAIVLFYAEKESQGKIMAFLSKHTMPIFLMHSIFAATLRSVLLKIGVNNAVIHITLGIVISIFGPIITACVMEKTKYLNFLIYPGRYITIKTEQRRVYISKKELTKSG